MAGIPNAGTPIIKAIERIVAQPRGFRIIKLSKEERDGKRRIIPEPGFNYRQGEVVLVLDDLVAKANTKIEAIEAISSDFKLNQQIKPAIIR